MNDLAARLCTQFEKQYEVQSDGCWLWTGAINGNGYGYFLAFGTRIPAYRFAYENWIGPIPDGLELDHLCRNRACVSYDHLEAVTHRENTLRGDGPSAKNARKTHCKRSHPLRGQNVRVVRGRRHCRLCELEGNRRRKNISPERWLLDAKGPNRTRCYNGHLQSNGTTYVYPGSGKRKCKVCLHESQKRYQERARQKVLMEV